MEKSYVRGLSYARQNKLGPAIEEFNKIIQAYPGYEPAYLNIANLYRREGNLKASRANYIHARDIGNVNSENFFEHRAWGIFYSYGTKHNLDNAVDLYNDRVVKHYSSSFFYERK